MSSLIDIASAAKYNEWANNRIYNALKSLSDEERRKDRNAFFKSIHNTMNHILLADLLYRQRLEKTPITFNSLDEIVHDDFSDLEVAHRSNDSWYSELCSTLTEEKLASDFSFKAVGLDVEEYYALPLKTCLTNLFQHQIHHRGQVHHMISHANYDPPPLDFVKFGSNDSDKWTNSLGQTD